MASEITTIANVAINKPATQSSFSQWSKKGEAANAVSGTLPRSFAFHTDLEQRPWWMVDLLYNYPIERIVVHNRLDGWEDRARNCSVEISTDGMTWSLIHSGLVHFTGGKGGQPLTLPLGCHICARFVRISLGTMNYLHLAQVEVFGSLVGEIKETLQLQDMPIIGDFSDPRLVHRQKRGLSYRIEREASVDGQTKIIGLKITSFGRLGNQIFQLIHAVALARRHQLKYIVFVSNGLINLRESLNVEGIQYVSSIEEVFESGAFIVGNFFYRGDLRPVLDGLSPEERYDIVSKIIRPQFMPRLSPSKEQADDELTIHFRSGDIFTNSNAMGYSQPPLSFYTLITRHLICNGEINRLRLVFEDRANPCIDAFIRYLEDRKFPYRIQSGTLIDDLSSLLDSPKLVLGFGTFGLAVCLLSKAIGVVYCLKGFSEGELKKMPSVTKVIAIEDRAGGYLKVGEWRNKPEQVQLMLEYPESALELVG